VTTQIKRNLGVLASALMIALSVGLMFWPVISRADTRLEKAGRGLAAMTTPFLEIPGNIVDTSQREGPLAGWTAGLARGLGMAIVRPAVGTYELVSAPFPAPANYEPIMEPEYPWSYFGRGDERPDVAAGRRR
jgi:putative exosortase-associated protein (TIGR04073 family)